MSSVRTTPGSRDSASCGGVGENPREDEDRRPKALRSSTSTCTERGARGRSASPEAGGSAGCADCGPAADAEYRAVPAGEPDTPLMRAAPVPYAWRRTLLSLAVAAMGVIDLLSALLSHPPERLMALRRLVPTEVLDSSRTFTLIAGSLLLVTAWGLRRGKRRAFIAALFLCALSVPVNLLKAFDLEEATVATALMFALGVSSEAFRVRSREVTFAALRSRTLWALLGLVLYAVAGAWVLQARFGVTPSVRGVLSDAVHQVVGTGRELAVPAGLPPAGRRIVIWYLRSLPVLALTLLVSVAIASLRPARHRRRHRANAARVAELVRSHGASSIAWFALDDENDYFFSRNRRAVIAYRFESDVLLAVGDPIGPREEALPLLEEFAEYCRSHDWRLGFFQARPEWLPLYRSLGWRAIHIGEDPVLRTDGFTLDGSAASVLRRALRKAEAGGVTVQHFVPGVNAFDPETAPAALVSQLREVSDDWLRGRPGGERGFCMGRFDLRRMSDVWLSVAWNPASERVEAFVTWVPVPARRGWALDLMRRGRHATAGVMELLVVRSLEEARARDDALLSLSLSALAMVRGEDAGMVAFEADDTPQKKAREFLMDHLARYYDFRGLFRWKRKFDPCFEDRYLVCRSPLDLPQVAWALFRAQTPGGLLSFVRPRGTAMAIRESA